MILKDTCVLSYEVMLLYGSLSQLGKEILESTNKSSISQNVGFDKVVVSSDVVIGLCSDLGKGLEMLYDVANKVTGDLVPTYHHIEEGTFTYLQ